jgi:hypothetical protein
MATCQYRFARFQSCGIFIPTRTIPVNNELKPQCDGAGDTSRTTNYELHGTGWATRAPVAQTLQTVRQPCSCTMTTCQYRFARFPSCGIFIPTCTIPVSNELKQQCGGAGEHPKNHKLRVAGHGLGNTHTRRTNTANRAPNMPMHHRHVPVRVCTISILWNFHTNPYQSSETTS